MTIQSRTIALASGLYHQVAARATTTHQSVRHTVEMLLAQALAHPDVRTTTMAQNLLAHAGLREGASARSTTHVATAVLDQCASIATVWTAHLHRSVRTGQVVNALLWHALTDDGAMPPPSDAIVVSPQAQASLTIAVSDELNTALRQHAEQSGVSRDRIVMALLQAQLTILDQARQQGAVGAQLAAPHLRPRHGTVTTIRVSRTLDSRLRAEEAIWAHQERWTTRPIKKGQIVEALLWWALDHAGAPPPPAQPVILAGELYERLHVQVRTEQQRTGMPTTIEQLVNRYVDERLRQEQDVLTKATTPAQ